MYAKCDCQYQYCYRNRESELIDGVTSDFSPRARYGRKEALQEEIVAGVENGAGPQIAGGVSQPGHDDTLTAYHDGEARYAEPPRRAIVVIREQQDREVPARPDDACQQGTPRET